MAYIHKIIGSDEKLIGIARLHWIYIAKGVVAFGICLIFAWVTDALVFQGLALLSRTTGTTNAAMPFLILNSYVMPVATGLGLLFFLFHLMLVLTTEIGLTTRRVIHKKGFLFVRVKEVDLVEIKGETLDLGYFGRVLGYGHLLLDCRFLGDIRFPAIEKPERFLKALHKSRADFTDAPTVFVPQSRPGETPPSPDAVLIHNGEVPEITGQDSGPAERTYLPAEKIAVQPHITINHVDARTVANVVHQVLPQMVEKVTEEMIARGIVPAGPQGEEPLEFLEGELISSFDEAISRPENGRKSIH